MIDVKNVYKVYENGTVALKNITLELPETGFVAIVGKSGSGKSTLLNVISNNDQPTNGEVLYCGNTISTIGDSLRRDFACVYQDFKLIENLTAYQNIAIGHELACKDIDKENVLQLAEKLGLTEYLDQKVFALSGGQQQRVAIARAVVREPKVIFADEPTGNLDSGNSQKVFEILKQLSKSKLVVVVSHNNNIVKFADRIIEISNGKVIKDCQNEQDIKSFFDYFTDKQPTSDNNFECKKSSEVAIYESVPKVDSTKHKISKNVSKIDSNNIFSYKKAKSKQRKSVGLSFKSTVGLTAALQSKRVTKKIILMVLSIIMIMLIFLTSAVVFSSPDKSFCHAMKNNKTPFVLINIGGSDFEMSVADYSKAKDFIKKESNQNVAVVSNTYLHNDFKLIKPADGTTPPFYAHEMRFGDSIFTDDPSELGIKIIKGQAPKINDEGQDEIAISKTFYEYFMSVGRFQNANGEVVDFSSRELIGSYIEEFRVKISGVFDDLNDYKMNTDKTEWNLRDYNDLSFKIIRPKSALIDSLSIMTGGYNIGYNECVVRLFNNDYRINHRDGFYGFYPNNASFKKYFYNKAELKTELAYDEIFVSEEFAENYCSATGKTLVEGDSLDFELVKLKKITGYKFIDERLLNKVTFKVKGIFSWLDAMVVNEQFFNKWVPPYFDGTMSLAVASRAITPKFMKKIRQFASEEIPLKSSGDNSVHDVAVSFGMTKYNENNEYENSIIDIARNYIALPLGILSLLSFGIIASVLMSDIVSEKGEDILILRSLGAKNLDLLKVFGGLVFAMLLVQFVAGCLCGIALTYGLNRFWMIVASSEFYIPTFFVSTLSTITMFVAIVAISCIVLFVKMNQLNDKNLRKLFQKQKE